MGDLNITGNAIAHNAGAGSASATFYGVSGAVFDDDPEADADLEIGGISFGHNVTVTGAITVDADATALGGDITITGHAISTAGEMNEAGTAIVSFDAPGSVWAFAYNESVNEYMDYGASATASLAISGSGNVTIDIVDGGGITVTADAIATAGNLKLSGSASAVALGDGGGDVNAPVLGFVGAQASAELIDRDVIGSAAFAEGAINIDASGDVTITNDVQVSMAATLTVGNVDIDGTAGASASGVNLGSSAFADADFTGVDGNLAGSGSAAFADGLLAIDGVGGDVTLDGSISVTGVADIDVGNIDVAGNAVARGSGSDGSADARFAGIDDHGVDDAQAIADLSIGDIGGGVTVGGTTTVTADATIDFGKISIIGGTSGGAKATASGSGDADASFVGMDRVARDADAVATFDLIDIDDDIVLTGDVLVAALGETTFGAITVSGTASAIGTGDDADARFIGFNGRLARDVTAEAVMNVISDVGPSADSFSAGADITITETANATFGNITVNGKGIATAGTNAFAEGAFEAFDEAFNLVRKADATAFGEGAGLEISNVSGNVSVTGDITLNADAGITFGTISITGGATASADSVGTANASFTAFNDEIARRRRRPDQELCPKVGDGAIRRRVWLS